MHGRRRGVSKFPRASAGLLLLNENCPQASCAGVPLVGFLGKRTARKTVGDSASHAAADGLSERDTSGMKLVPALSATSPSVSGQGTDKEPGRCFRSRGGEVEGQAKRRCRAESPRSRTIRELYEAGSMMNTRKEEKAGQLPSAEPLDFEKDDIENIEISSVATQQQVSEARRIGESLWDGHAMVRLADIRQQADIISLGRLRYPQRPTPWHSPSTAWHSRLQGTRQARAMTMSRATLSTSAPHRGDQGRASCHHLSRGRQASVLVKLQPSAHSAMSVSLSQPCHATPCNAYAVMSISSDTFRQSKKRSGRSA